MSLLLALSSSGGGTSSAVGSVTGSAVVSGVGNTLVRVSAVGSISGTATVSGVGASIASATGTIGGTSTATAVAGGSIAYPQLPRLPLDPLLPVSDDINAMMTRVGQVYRVIAVFHNTVTQSVAGDYEQMPLQAPTPFSLNGLQVVWNDQQRKIVTSHNKIAEAVTGQYMANRLMINVPTVQSFRTQFYDQYRIITQNYNALAEIIDTNNGY